jgi:hypothetical protein
MNHVKHLVLPGYEQARQVIVEGESIADFIERVEWDFNLPTICVRDGAPVMRKDWATTTVSSRDNIVFYSKPFGPGGGGGGSKWKMVVGLVALVALAAFAPWAAGALGFASGTFGFFAITSAITLGGGLLVSSFLQPKAATNDSEQVSQIYSLTAAGNTANPFQVIPVQYGKLKVAPPYAAIPWTEFVGNDAYLNVLLARGQGNYHIHQVLIDDTIVWDESTGYSANFTDVTMQHCDPGVPFTLFPSNVVSSSEVNGQEITNVPLGYFIVNNAGTTLTDIAFDIVFPAGCRYTDDDGKHWNWNTYIYAQIQRVDNTGTPIGPEYYVLSNENVEYNTPQPIRKTFKFNLDAIGIPRGRYQAKIWRDPTTSTDTDHVVDVMQWAGLRGFLEGSNTFPNCSVTGIRIKASAQLSQNSAKNFAVIQTRKLNVWNGSAFVEQATQNAWWAFYDAATNASYGAGWAVNKIDFQTIVDQATAADVRGDTFNYRFDSSITYQAAFDTILMSNRAKVTWLGDVLSATRDEWQPIPSMLISDQQIIRGSLEVDYVLNSEDSADCVQGQFLNEDTWQPASLQYPPNSGSFTAQRPAAMQLDGVTNAAQLFEELRFFWKQSQLRRIKVRLDTEHDGRLLRFGSPVKVQSFLPKKWGASGEVVSYNSGTHTVTVSRKDLDTAELGQHYIEFRSKTGAYFGPVKCSFGAQAWLIVLDTVDLAAVETALGMTISDAFDRMDGAEPPSFVWGLESNLARNCIVLSGKPNGHKVSLEMVVDSEEVHSNSGDTVPPLPEPPPYVDPRAPVVAGLIGNIQQNGTSAELNATWWPSKGALYYKAQVSYDDGLSWTTIADALSVPALTQTVAYADLKLRVAAVGFLQGPWSQIALTAPVITSPVIVTPEDFEAGLKQWVMKDLKARTEELSKVVQQIAAIAAETDASATRQGNILRAVASQAFAEVSTLATVVADNEVAFASYQTTVTAQFGSLEASVATNSAAIATQEGIVNAMYSLTLNVNGYISGFTSINDGATSSFVVQADHFVVATAGQIPIAVFDVGTVGGVASIGMKGNFMLDGTITATALAVSQLSSITADIGTVTAGKILSPSGNFVIDATNERIEIWS